ncbi:hypothetical protein ACK280_27705, partial [Mycobacterium sherrisii]|uniref:hypothetical protein n=1 Tax=Mycobacterium sherrisii TaxID=243061 RepID=UPI0039762E50
SGLCRFLVAMILSSLPAHNLGRKTLISHGSTDRGQVNLAVADLDVNGVDEGTAARIGDSFFTRPGWPVWS